MVSLATVAPVGTLPVGEMVDVPGRGTTFVVDTGPTSSTAPPLILLHSMACTGMLTWYPHFDRLAAKGRIVVFDQRWHGRGFRTPSFTLEDCADDAVALADVLGIDRFIAVGYSMGSLVGQLVWRRHRERVAGLVLCAAAANFRLAPRERVSMDMISRAVDAFAPKAGALRLDSVTPEKGDRAWAIGQFRQTSSGAVGRATAEVGKFDSTNWIADIDVPTAVVVTARDRVLPPSRQRWIARQIRGAASYDVNCGHASCVLEADEFSSGLMPACASVISRARL